MSALFCLCYLYVQGGIAYGLPHNSAEVIGKEYWYYDRNVYSNPLAVAQVGYAIEGRRFTVDFYARHESFPLVRDHGENSLGIAIRFNPWR